MARVTITIDTDNAAFEDAGRAHETARILRELADRIEDTDLPNGMLHLRDVNGNTVGQFEVEPGGE